MHGGATVSQSVLGHVRSDRDVADAGRHESLRVSAVIPTFNRVQIVGRAIESALTNSPAIFEVIVVDDGSTDGTLELLRGLANTEPRLRILSLGGNGGASRARNAGVMHAQGDWIAFLDSDDYWLPGKLALQLDALQAAPGAVASFTGGVNPATRMEYWLPGACSPADLQLTNVLGSTSMALIRKDAFLRVGGFDATMPSCQDWDLWTRLSEVGPFALVQQPAFVYDTTGTGRISSDMTRVITGHRVMRDRALAAAGTWRRRRRILSRYHRRLAEIYLTEAARPLMAIFEASVSLLNMPSAGAANILALAAVRSLVPGRST